MGLEINFYSRCTAPPEGQLPDGLAPAGEKSCATLTADLFEAPDALKFHGVGGGTEDGVKAAGFLPPFVKTYREHFGSGLQAIYAPDEAVAYDPDAFFEEMSAHMEAGGCAADFLPEHLDIPVDAQEVAQWADLWLVILGDANAKGTEALKVFLPYNFDGYDEVVNELQSLSRHARLANEESRQLHMTALLD